MRKVVFLILLQFVFKFMYSDNTENLKNDQYNKFELNTLIDGCSGTASFIATYDAANCCWTFQNTTTNDCMQWYCIWDFGDGSPTVSTPQGQTTVCHQFPGPGIYTVSLQFNSSACHGGSGGVCYGSQDVTIPQLNLSSSQSNYNGYNVSCEGAQDGWISMSSVTNYTYEWPVGPNTPWSLPQTGPTVDSLPAGNYTVLATGANGCTGSMNITITEPILTGNAQLSDPSCFGYSDGNIDFTPVGGFAPYTYFWSNGSTLEDPSGLSSNNYSLVLIDSYGCSDTVSYFLDEPSPIVSSFTTSDYNGYNVSCNGDSNAYIDFSISGSVPPYMFQWNNGLTSEDIYNISAGSYTLLITDDNLCTKVDTVLITEPSNLSSNLYSAFNYNGYDISCFGDTNGGINLIVTGSVSPYNFTWNTSSNNQNIFNLGAGTYDVVVVDANGCEINDTILLSEPTPLNSNISSLNNYNGFDVSCNGFSDGNIDLNVNGSVYPYEYSWNTGDTTQDLNNVSASYYSVNIVDANNCVMFQDITLLQPPNFNSTDSLSNYNGVNISCYNYNDGSIDFEISGSVPPYNYMWNNSSTSQDIFSLGVGIYNVQVTDNNGCIFLDTFTLIEPLIITTTTNLFPACHNENNGSVNLSVVGGIPGYTVNWFGVNPDSLTSGIYNFEITDLNNCIYIDSVEILQPSLPFSVIENISNVNCNGGINGSVTLNISGNTPPYYVTWQNNISPNNLLSGIYYYEINDLNNCSYSDSVMIIEPSPISVSQNTIDVSCFNGSDGKVSLNISGGTYPYSVDWVGFDTNNLEAGTYNFTITDQNNCLYSGITIINEPNPIDVIYTINNPSCNNTNDGFVNLNISGGTPPYNTNWFGQNPNQLYAGSFQFIVSDDNLCEDTNHVNLVSISNISVDETIYEVSCKSFCDGEVDLIINNGIPPYTVNFFGDNPDSLCEGNFNYEIIDSLGCVFSNNGFIDAPDSVDLILTLVSSQVIMANANGGNPPYVYNWFTNATLFSNNQSISPTNSGTYYCVASDINSCQSDTMKIYYSSELGIDFYDFTEIVLYPNPTSDIINLEFFSKNSNDIEFFITNSLGQVISDEKINNISGKYTYKFNFSEFAKGIYYITMRTSESSINYKIIYK